MKSNIHTLIPTSRTASPATVSPETFRQPNYDCKDQRDAMKLTVYVPGVEAAGVEIEARGADLTITARKSHFVRVNWQALHLETAQRDYQLRLRLGHHFAYEAMQAEIRHGVLTVALPKRAAAAARIRRVA
ncbi:MAG: Hsp20/alpha crystallin family protein [Verrucomicrobia bacterium]|nr:Hsp20/alpha crystallin family protein [Verrucomicrobiota bacterium]